MSVCIVASYPWKRIVDLDGIDTPGIIVCSDTRATASDGSVVRWKFNKQRLVAPNILVCYTSSHGSATTAALQRGWGKRGIRGISHALCREHARLGGLTQLLAIVWRDKRPPLVWELTPPNYQPTTRTGIVGIGDPGALKWFKNNFEEDPRPRLEKSRPDPRLVAAFSRQMGGPVEFPEPQFTIDDAALSVAAALMVGIEEAGGPTVGLPLQVMTVLRGVVQEVPIVAMGSDLQAKMATTTHAETRLPAPRFPRGPTDNRRLPALQLFP